MTESNERKYDAIVVGLGPGGATAAYELSRAGLSVLALDQARFPRYKPCGGGLSRRIDRILDPDFHAVIERVVFGTTIKFPNGNAVHVRSEQPVVYMVMRDRFDDFLVQKARRGGVDVRQGERVLEVAEHEDRVEVRTVNRTYRGRFLIGADGTNSLTARNLGFYRGRTRAVLIEGEIGVRESAARRFEDEAVLEFGYLTHGYGWIFPKSDHLSLGIGGRGDTARHAKDHYQNFVDRYNISEERDGKRYGYSLPLWTRRRRLTTRRVLLVGDAAGLVDALTGEGIYYAVRSGQFAARAIIHSRGSETADLSEYERLLAGAIYPELAVARKIAFLVYTFPKLGQAAVLKNPGILEKYSELLRGNLRYQDLWRESRNKLVSNLVRFAWLGRILKRPAAEPFKTEPGTDEP